MTELLVILHLTLDALFETLVAKNENVVVLYNNNMKLLRKATVAVIV